MDAPPVDALVIGAGPAGLTAALYLTRFKRRVRVVHDGTARALWVPRTRNVPGFPDGIVGKELIERMTDHARRYGAEIASGRVATLERARDHFRATLEDGEIIAARGVILATGVETNLAELDEGDHMTAVRDGVLRYCPVCDGFEHRDERIAVLGSDLHGAAEAMFLRQFSPDVTLIPKWRVALSDAQRKELADSDVVVLEGQVERLAATASAIAVQMRGEPVARRFDFSIRPSDRVRAASLQNGWARWPMMRIACRSAPFPTASSPVSTLPAMSSRGSTRSASRWGRARWRRRGCIIGCATPKAI